MISAAVGAAYPHEIFLTYNGPDMAPCLPGMPKLYIYSHKRNFTEKPWFVNECDVR